jgi:hypothetical protein
MWIVLGMLADMPARPYDLNTLSEIVYKPRFICFANLIGLQECPERVRFFAFNNRQALERRRQVA